MHFYVPLINASSRNQSVDFNKCKKKKKFENKSVDISEILFSILNI